jgi:hypothetical protein
MARSLIKMFQEDEEFVSKFLGSALSKIVPALLVSVRGSFEFVVDSESIADLLKLPQAEMAQANAHSLLVGMSPWGTLDDLELINLEADEDQEITPIWHGVPGHDEF